MKIAYFDCFSGISGDMILGALIDAGLKPAELKRELGKLSLRGYEFKTRKVKRRGIGGTKVEIVSREKGKKRGPGQILKIVERSKLDREIKEESKRIFTRLAAAEKRIHRRKKGDTHFHELGDLDAIIDVVGSLSGLRLLGVKRVYSSFLHLGSGFVQCLHGTLPLPAPATLELLKGVPVYGRDIAGELVTPTGAVLISSLSSRFGEMPSLKVEKIGYGAGSRDLAIPNLLRIIIGRESDPGCQEDRVILLETNIDDMNPQVYAHLMKLLFARGALDVWLTPIQMKKNRPAITLSLLSEEKDFEDLSRTVFSGDFHPGREIFSLEEKKVRTRAKDGQNEVWYN